MSRSLRRRRGALALLACATLLGAGCGGSDDDGARTVATSAATTAASGSTAAGRPVTDEQALVLARLLQQNWQHGGATFAGTTPIQGVEVELHGKVDFRTGRGDATLTDPQGQTRRYIWTRRAVYAQKAPGSRAYTVQRPDRDGDPVHAAIAFINLLSAETIDNTTNIKDQDARFLGSETLGGAAVDLYRYGASGNTRYWVDRRDGLLRQVEATFPNDEVLTVRLTAHRPVHVTLPPADRSAQRAGS